MTNHQPTRMCPHRYCRPTHTAIGVLALVFFVQVLFASIAAIVFCGALAVIGLAVGRLVQQKTIAQQVLEDEADRAAGTVLIVRTGWATAAIVLDLLVLLGVAVSVSGLFVTRSMSAPTGGVSTYVALGVGVGLTAAIEFAHRQATRPARPKRVTKLAPVGGGA